MSAEVSQVRVEFFGLARTCSGVESVLLDVSTLGDVIRELSVRFPDLAGMCFDGQSVRPEWLFSLNGRTFTRDLQARLADGDLLLLLSADAGG